MYRLKNHTEETVAALAELCLKEAGACSCEKCRLDTMAIALNMLPPAYVVTEVGEIFAAIDSTLTQNAVDARVAVMKAAKMVKASPKH